MYSFMFNRTSLHYTKNLQSTLPSYNLKIWSQTFENDHARTQSVLIYVVFLMTLYVDHVMVDFRDAFHSKLIILILYAPLILTA